MKHLPGLASSLGLALGLALCVSGCASIGADSISRDRLDYNESLADSWKRQILLNIVKMRYAEPLFFMDVGQIVAGYTIESGVSLTGTSGTIGNIAHTTATTPSISGKYTDRPTITYVPLTGNAFVKSLVLPLPPENLMTAIQSGIPADIIFKRSVASINGLRNRSAPVAGYAPADPRFLQTVDLFRKLQGVGALRVRVDKDRTRGRMATVVFATRTATPEIAQWQRELRTLLGLDPAATSYALVYGAEAENNREIALESFSLMHLLSGLAARVEIPANEIGDGRAYPGAAEAEGDGAGEFRVKCADAKPADAFAAVRYRDHWYWIDDRDLESKRAISFILLVFTLAENERRDSPPQITIPAQ